MLLKRAYIDNHEHFWIYAHVVLQKGGQLGIAIGHVLALGVDGIDHVTQEA